MLLRAGGCSESFLRWWNGSYPLEQDTAAYLNPYEARHSSNFRSSELIVGALRHLRKDRVPFRSI